MYILVSEGGKVSFAVKVQACEDSDSVDAFIFKIVPGNFLETVGGKVHLFH